MVTGNINKVMVKVTSIITFRRIPHFTKHCKYFLLLILSLIHTEMAFTGRNNCRSSKIASLWVELSHKALLHLIKNSLFLVWKS